MLLTVALVGVSAATVAGVASKKFSALWHKIFQKNSATVFHRFVAYAAPRCISAAYAINRL